MNISNFFLILAVFWSSTVVNKTQTARNPLSSLKAVVSKTATGVSKTATGVSKTVTSVSKTAGDVSLTVQGVKLLTEKEAKDENLDLMIDSNSKFVIQQKSSTDFRVGCKVEIFFEWKGEKVDIFLHSTQHPSIQTDVALRLSYDPSIERIKLNSRFRLNWDREESHPIMFGIKRFEKIVIYFEEHQFRITLGSDNDWTLMYSTRLPYRTIHAVTTTGAEDAKIRITHPAQPRNDAHVVHDMVTERFLDNFEDITKHHESLPSFKSGSMIKLEFEMESRFDIYLHLKRQNNIQDLIPFHMAVFKKENIIIFDSTIKQQWSNEKRMSGFNFEDTRTVVKIVFDRFQTNITIGNTTVFYETQLLGDTVEEITITGDGEFYSCTFEHPKNFKKTVIKTSSNDGNGIETDGEKRREAQTQDPRKAPNKIQNQDKTTEKDDPKKDDVEKNQNGNACGNEDTLDDETLLTGDGNENDKKLCLIRMADASQNTVYKLAKDVDAVVLPTNPPAAQSDSFTEGTVQTQEGSGSEGHEILNM